jgi:hypothetical protein
MRRPLSNGGFMPEKRIEILAVAEQRKTVEEELL